MSQIGSFLFLRLTKQQVMQSFREFINEVFDMIVRSQVTWKTGPNVNADSVAIFTANELLYSVLFVPYDSSIMFKNKEKTILGYKVFFDPVCDKGGNPVPAKRMIDDPDWYQGISQASKKDRKKGDKSFQRVEKVATKFDGYVFSKVLSILQDFVDRINPAVLAWKPADVQLDRFYYLLMTKQSRNLGFDLVSLNGRMGDGTYAGAGLRLMVRNDLVDYLKSGFVNGWKR